MEKIEKQQLRSAIEENLYKFFGVKAEEATTNQMYKAVCFTVKDALTKKRMNFKKTCSEQQNKEVYYMSMEFLLGRSLKNHMFNLGITEDISALVEEFGKSMDDIFAIEPDAGLGNGGLGRLAAAYMESLTNLDYEASGFSIKYDFGIFRQKMVDGMQIELADEWLDNGSVWLAAREEDTFTVKFGGEIQQYWEGDKLKVRQQNGYTVIAVPYDMSISGFNCHAVNKLRLWTAKAPVDFDLQLFSRGEYVKAQENKSLAESISKVLYPADDHFEGKSLRLKQQYFFVSASLQSILKKHLRDFGGLDNLPEKVAIHINDTHPALCIPELMRLLLDVYEYSWEEAWDIVTKTMSYTNHTVMAEALEKWPETLFGQLLPRIYQIVTEINKRYCVELWDNYPNDWNKVAHNAVISHNEVKMANLCLVAAHTINGVSALHSEILKNDVFRDQYAMHPSKYTNVTNGITYRRWLAQSNPRLTAFVKELIGEGFLRDANELKKLREFQSNAKVLDEINAIKFKNKVDLANYIKKANGIVIDPNSIFDVQVKRLHEYKRQLLNAMHILDLYYRIKENPNEDIVPRTFIFGAKAAPSYYMAKQIIKMICMLGEMINNDPTINDKIKVVFIENYRVTLAEMIMPASEVSEQISVAGKEASGTGNMKFMINGAITIGTMDGANIEIHENVGDENIFIFGLLAEEIEKLYREGYSPTSYYHNNARLRAVIDGLRDGIAGVNFGDIADNLTMGRGGFADSYMIMADFESYCDAQARLDRAYKDRKKWAAMSLMNTAGSGFFSSDRSVKEYADRIWGLDPVKF